jgi:5'(3')-deoxyribonucleotidase
MESSSKQIIAVDVDDVIAANAIGFVAYSNKKYGTNLTVDDYQEHWGEVWKTDYEEAERRAVEYHESGHIATYGVIEGAYDVLKELKERFTLVVLTTRRNAINQLTKDWINKYYPDIFDKVTFSGFFDSPTEKSIQMTKGDLAKSIGANYLIDDQSKHVLSAAEKGMKGLLFGDYAWNSIEKLPSDIIRVTNWEEVRKYFAEQ